MCMYTHTQIYTHVYTHTHTQIYIHVHMQLPRCTEAQNPPANAGDQETQVRSPGWDDALKEGMMTHSSILAWRILRTEEPGGLPPRGHQEAGLGGGCVRAHLPRLQQGVLSECVVPTLTDLSAFPPLSTMNVSKYRR